MCVEEVVVSLYTLEFSHIKMLGIWNLASSQSVCFKTSAPLSPWSLYFWGRERGLSYLGAEEEFPLQDINWKHHHEYDEDNSQCSGDI